MSFRVWGKVQWGWEITSWCKAGGITIWAGVYTERDLGGRAEAGDKHPTVTQGKKVTSEGVRGETAKG